MGDQVQEISSSSNTSWNQRNQQHSDKSQEDRQGYRNDEGRSKSNKSEVEVVDLEEDDGTSRYPAPRSHTGGATSYMTPANRRSSFERDSGQATSTRSSDRYREADSRSNVSSGGGSGGGASYSARHKQVDPTLVSSSRGDENEIQAVAPTTRRELDTRGQGQIC